MSQNLVRSYHIYPVNTYTHLRQEIFVVQNINEGKSRCSSGLTTSYITLKTSEVLRFHLLSWFWFGLGSSSLTNLGISAEDICHTHPLCPKENRWTCEVSVIKRQGVKDRRIAQLCVMTCLCLLMHAYFILKRRLYCFHSPLQYSQK